MSSLKNGVILCETVEKWLANVSVQVLGTDYSREKLK